MMGNARALSTIPQPAAGPRPADVEQGGQLLYQFHRPWHDGVTALLLDPLELLERLAALVPPPRRPLVAYHGILIYRPSFPATR